jgi:hypothetical protein
LLTDKANNMPSCAVVADLTGTQGRKRVITLNDLAWKLS